MKIKYSINKNGRFKNGFPWCEVEDSDGAFVTIEYHYKDGLISTCTGLSTSSLRGIRRIARIIKTIPKGTIIRLRSIRRGTIEIKTY